MLITFNKSGSLVNIDFQNDSFCQGDSNVHTIDVIVDEKGFKNGRYNCYIQFLREGETTPSPKLIMSNKVISYNDTKYSGFSFQMASDWYTAISGILKATIELKRYNTDGVESNKAFGVINIPVMESVSGISDVETTITNEEYLALVNSLNEKANINTENTFSERQYFKENLYISKDICSEGNDHFVAGANSEGGYVYLENADAHKLVSIKPNKIELECENKKKSISLNPGEDAIEISDLYISNKLSVDKRATFNEEATFNDGVKVGNNTSIKDQKIVTPNIDVGDATIHNLMVGENIVISDETDIKITDMAQLGINSDGGFLYLEGRGANSGYTEIDNTKVSTHRIVFNDSVGNLLSQEIDGTTKRIIEFEDGNTYIFGDSSFDTIINSATKPRWYDNDSGDYKELATTEDIDEKVADLVNSAPEALNTLGELATALQNHEDAYDSLLEVVGKKADATPNPKFDSVNIDDKIFIDSEEGFNAGGVRLNSDGLHLEGTTANSGYTKITHEEIEHNGLTYQYPEKSGTLATLEDIGSGGGSLPTNPEFESVYSYGEIYSEDNIKSETIVEGRILKEDGVELKDKYATLKDLGDINSILDILNGEVV